MEGLGGSPGPHLLEEHGRLRTLAARRPQIDGALLPDKGAEYQYWVKLSVGERCN